MGPAGHAGWAVGRGMGVGVGGLGALGDLDEECGTAASMMLSVFFFFSSLDNSVLWFRLGCRCHGLFIYLFDLASERFRTTLKLRKQSTTCADETPQPSPATRIERWATSPTHSIPPPFSPSPLPYTSYSPVSRSALGNAL